MNALKIISLIVFIIMLYNNFHIYEDTSDYEYNDKNKMIISRKYRCYKYFMNDNQLNNDINNDIKTYNYFNRKCSSFKHEIINTKLERNLIYSRNTIKKISMIIITCIIYYYMI